jgi:hypothetical protein
MDDLLISVCKFTSITLTGVFGVLALARPYRDKEGQLTRWGRIALRGAIVSFVIAALSQSLEMRRAAVQSLAAQAKTEEELERFSRLLHEIQRTSHPIDEIRVGFEVELPIRHAALQDVVARLDAAFASLRPLPGTERDAALARMAGTYFFDSYGESGEPLLAVDYRSPLMPQEGTPAAAMVRTRILLFELYVDAATAARTIRGSGGMPDLSFIADFNAIRDPSSLSLLYGQRTHSVRQSVGDVREILRTQNGRLVSTLDLPGATMIVTPVNYNAEIDGDIALHGITLRIGKGYQFSIPSSGITRIPGVSALAPPRFTYRFAAEER